MPGIGAKIYSRKFYAMPAALAIVVFIMSMPSGNTLSALENAFRYKSYPNNIAGAYSYIETANPDVDSGWSYHRVFVQEITHDSDVIYVEIG